MIDIINLDGFDWDEGNEFKSYTKHNVTKKESEEVFYNAPLFFGKGKNNNNETRMLVYGKSNSDRLLTVVFIIRNGKIRIISARPQSKNERKYYYEKSKKEK